MAGVGSLKNFPSARNKIMTVLQDQACRGFTKVGWKFYDLAGGIAMLQHPLDPTKKVGIDYAGRLVKAPW